MGSLTASLLGASSALDAFQYALNVSQNNIDNSSTAGYANQEAVLQADPFDPAGGLLGGVSDGHMVDSRDLLAESDVWQQSGAQGDASAQSRGAFRGPKRLAQSSGSGIPAALTTFFSDVSAWSASPDDASVQQNVMVRRRLPLAQSFQSTAAAVASVAQSVTQDIQHTVDQINQLTSQSATLNGDCRMAASTTTGCRRRLYNSLQSLSGLVNINVLPQPDGGVNVTL